MDTDTLSPAPAGAPSPRPRRLRRLLQVPGAIAVLALAGFVAVTEQEIDGQAELVAGQAARHAPPAWRAEDLAALPVNVQRYLSFAIREPAAYRIVEIEQSGSFRRPGSSSFNDTRVHQSVATGTPAMLFAATTWLVPGFWARAYDAYADGEMTMKARVLSAITVVDERESVALNWISLHRWLLESPLYPMALLPGGPVSWEAIDTHRARATVRAGGLSASLVASFREDGSLEQFVAEEDGDLSTPYHGSGEHVNRSDYRLVSGMMIPMRFTISRVANGKVLPFWSGEVTKLAFR